MTRFVALLRGINVGGKNVVKMADLRGAFEQAGFAEVSTYINSGNVLFSTDGDAAAAGSAEVATLRERCEKIMRENFAVTNPVLVISARELCETMQHAPDWWGDDPDIKHNAIFMLPPLTAAEACAEIGDIYPEYERIASWGQLIFWSAPLKTFGRTRLSQKLVGTDLYLQTTIRNANTARKLAQLVST